MHAGALSQGNRFRSHGVAPSAVQPKGKQMTFYHGKGEYAVPHEISEEEIAQVVQGFVDSAVRAVRISGFDGIEIHGANGYLLDQFLTTHTNLRTDRWGGPVERRVGLLAEVLAAVKAAVGEQAPVGIRISQGKVNDFTRRGALANPDMPTLWQRALVPRAFDSAILGPIANIKVSELALAVID